MVVTTGNTIVEVTRIPTGIPPLDLILGGGIPAGGGGIPAGRVIEIFGPPGSCKSICATKIVASKQHISPEQTCVWIAVEQFDPIWAKKFGIDVNKLMLVNPNYAEQIVDVAEGSMEADDVGLVVLDLLGAMVTQKEIGNSKSDGDLAMVCKRLFNKVVDAQRKAEKKGRAPTFIFTNQMRYRKGVAGEMTTPGGFTPRHAAAIRLRLSAKDIVDKAINTSLPARKEVRVVVEKHTVPILAQECTFEIAMLNQPGLLFGQVSNN